MKIRLLLILFLLLGHFSIGAVNIVTYTISDSVEIAAEQLEMQYKCISNENDRVRITFDLKSANVPFTIYDAKWINCDSETKPLEPFSLIAKTDEIAGKSTEWSISLDFPFSEKFDDSDVLILNTDKGIVRCPTSREGELKESIDFIRHDYEDRLDRSKRNSLTAWTVLYSLLTFVIIISFIVFITVRRRLRRKREEIEEISTLLTERTNHNHELESKVNELYGSRLDTLNMLCNEYFEKGDSERMKLTLYNEVEKHIMTLRDHKSISELEDIVNRYLDNILVRVKEQLPELSRKDLTFLTYLYAGFSPRAICIFTDIKIKNFYNRRSRLKDRIMASDAPDKDYFASKMQL